MRKNRIKREKNSEGFENRGSRGCWYREKEGEMFAWLAWGVGAVAKSPATVAQRWWGTDSNDAWSDWWSSWCRLSSLTERRAVARIRSSHSEALRATSFREEKERLDGIHQISPSTGIAIKILRFEKVPSFSRKYSFSVAGTLRHVHTRTRTRTRTRTGSHNPYIRNRLSFSRWSLHVTQTEHRRGSKARERRAACCSKREEIFVDRSNFFVSLLVRWENRNGCASNVNPQERIVGVAVFVFSKLIRTTAVSS